MVPPNRSYDVKYTMDGLNRVTQAEEGTYSGGSISNKSRDEQWTLDQVGNWSRDKLDLNGDGDFVDTNEFNDRRTHNVVNELTARDTNNDLANDYNLTYDANGNLTNDAQAYKYSYDAWGRLVTVKNQSSTTVAEYSYNGLGHRIRFLQDTDSDGDADAFDFTFYFAYDDAWRIKQGLGGGRAS